MRVGPGKADTGRATAHTCRLQYRDLHARLGQPVSNRRAHHAPLRSRSFWSLVSPSTSDGLWHATTAPSPDRRRHRGNVLALRYFLAEDLECYLHPVARRWGSARIRAAIRSHREIALSRRSPEHVRVEKLVAEFPVGVIRTGHVTKRRQFRIERYEFDRARMVIFPQCGRPPSGNNISSISAVSAATAWFS